MVRRRDKEESVHPIGINNLDEGKFVSYPHRYP